jgi:hypothetical protein
VAAPDAIAIVRVSPWTMRTLAPTGGMDGLGVTMKLEGAAATPFDVVMTNCPELVPATVAVTDVADWVTIGARTPLMVTTVAASPMCCPVTVNVAPGTAWSGDTA